MYIPKGLKEKDKDHIFHSTGHSKIKTQVNWNKVYDRYKNLIDRAGSRSEFSDIVWEMQGELGTSHCYEFGGDYQYGRYYNICHLAASYTYDHKAKGYQISHITKVDL